MTGHEKENPEERDLSEESLAAWEAELAAEPIVYGAAEEDVSEGLAALVEAIATFGKTAEDGLVNAVNEAVPFLKEMDDMAKEMVQSIRDGLTEKADEIREWFTAQPPEKVVDAIVEGVKVAQTYLQEWMDEHQIGAMTLLIPNLDRTGAREVTFGRITDVEREFPHLVDAQINMIATTPIKKAPPESEGPESGGYL
jgi:uncharacterized protein YjgD (DUF1641 family)